VLSYKDEEPRWSDCAHLSFLKKYLCSHFTIVDVEQGVDGQKETFLKDSICGFMLGSSHNISFFA